MLGMSYQRRAVGGSRAAAKPIDYMNQLIEAIQDQRIEAHDRLLGRLVEPTLEDGILQFPPTDTTRYEEYLKQGGLSDDFVQDLLFTPLSYPGGLEWQRERLKAHRDHLVSIGESVKAWIETKRAAPAAAGIDLRDVPIGLADVPTCSAGAGFVPGGGAFILLNRGMIVLPSWFAALRKLPHVWNELDPRDEGLLVPLGAAAVALKAMRSVSLPGLNRFTHDLLRTGEFCSILSDSWHLPASAQFDGMRKENVLCERFMLGHEFAHIALGHTNRLSEWRDDWDLPEEERLERLASVQQWELEADQFALAVMLDLSRDSRRAMHDFKHLFCTDQALDALFCLFALFHVDEVLTEPRDANERLHPPAKERFLHIVEGYAELHSAGGDFVQASSTAAGYAMDNLGNALGGAFINSGGTLLRTPDTEGL